MKLTNALASALGNATSPVRQNNTGAYGRGWTAGTGYGGARATLLGAMGSNGTLFAVVSRYANATSQVCWELFRKTRAFDTSTARPVTSHLALDVWAMPNAYATQQQFVEASQQHLDLVGECWWIVARNELGWPESMWLVRPDKMTPVPSAYGLAGYVYTGPTGEQVPLGTDEVIWLKQPNPSDPTPIGRGMGAAQTILAQLESITFSQEWNRNFFLNSAMPAGLLVTESTIQDDDFKKLIDQWREQHKGVANAGRVAVLENAKASFTDLSTTQRDMQFTELLNTGRDVIREAYSMPKFMLGLVDDVNRATAEASDASFGTWGLVPRLERIKQALNYRFLPMFGPSGHGTGTPDVEFRYDDPVPPDIAAQTAELTSRANAYSVLVTAGVDPLDAAEVAGLPPMHVIAPPAPALKVPSSTQPALEGEPADA